MLTQPNGSVTSKEFQALTALGSSQHQSLSQQVSANPEVALGLQTTMGRDSGPCRERNCHDLRPRGVSLSLEALLGPELTQDHTSQRECNDCLSLSPLGGCLNTGPLPVGVWILIG